MTENQTLLPLNIESTSPAQSRRKTKLAGAVLVLAVMAILGFVLAGATYPSTQQAQETSTEALEGESDLIPMTRYEVPDLYCNDGTPAVYFLRKSTDPDEKRWLIRFEGGGNCASADACEDRWATRPQDMTTIWNETIYEDEESGIMCADPELNPLFWNFNHVYCHYCSSDSWLGTLALDDPENELDWHFNGYNIMMTILDELVEHHGIEDASHIMTFGLSVGGTMMYNMVDRFYDYWAEHVPDAVSLYTGDAGWMLYNWNFGISDMGTQGEYQYENHKPALDPKCLEANYTWECYYPSEWQFQYIEHVDSLLVLNTMFDKMDMGLPLGDPETWSEAQFDWAMDRAEYVIETITNQAHHVYLSNCRSHDSTDKIDFMDITIDDLNIEHALYNLINDNGEEQLWMIDEEVYPEANPSCPFDQLEWNKIHCGDFWISDCEDETSVETEESSESTTTEEEEESTEEQEEEVEEETSEEEEEVEEETSEEEEEVEEETSEEEEEVEEETSEEEEEVEEETSEEEEEVEEESTEEEESSTAEEEVEEATSAEEDETSTAEEATSTEEEAVEEETSTEEEEEETSASGDEE